MLGGGWEFAWLTGSQGPLLLVGDVSLRSWLGLAVVENNKSLFLAYTTGPQVGRVVEHFCPRGVPESGKVPADSTLAIRRLLTTHWLVQVT